MLIDHGMIKWYVGFSGVITLVTFVVLAITLLGLYNQWNIRDDLNGSQSMTMYKSTSLKCRTHPAKLTADFSSNISIIDHLEMVESRNRVSGTYFKLQEADE